MREDAQSFRVSWTDRICLTKPVVIDGSFQQPLWYCSEVLLGFRAPADNARGPLYMDQALAAIHLANRTGESLSLILGGHAGTVGLLLRTDGYLRWVVERQFIAQYPDGAIDRLGIEPQGAAAGGDTFVASIALALDFFPFAGIHSLKMRSIARWPIRSSECWRRSIATDSSACSAGWNGRLCRRDRGASHGPGGA